VEGKFSNIEKLQSILDISGVTNKGINHVYKNMFTSTVLEDVTCGKFRVARSVSKIMIEGINTLLCPGNPEF